MVIRKSRHQKGSLSDLAPSNPAPVASHLPFAYKYRRPPSFFLLLASSSSVCRPSFQTPLTPELEAPPLPRRVKTFLAAASTWFDQRTLPLSSIVQVRPFFLVIDLHLLGFFPYSSAIRAFNESFILFLVNAYFVESFWPLCFRSSTSICFRSRHLYLSYRFICSA